MRTIIIRYFASLLILYFYDTLLIYKCLIKYCKMHFAQVLSYIFMEVYMRYLELKDGWLNLDTMEKRQYGEFVIEAFNTEGEAYEEILSRTGKDKSNYIFEKKEILSDDEWEFIEIGCLSEMIFEYLFEEKCEIYHSEEFRKSYTPPLTADDFEKLHNIIPNTKNEYINTIDFYLANILARFKSFPAEKYYYDYEWHNMYTVSDTVYNFHDFECIDNVIPKLLFVILDMIHLRKQKIKITYCRNDECMKFFIPSKSNSKFCTSCSANYKKNYNEEYNNSTKGLIFKASRYMNSATVFSNVEISDFKDKALKAYEEMTEENFIKWIGEEHSNLKLESKRRKQKLKVGT